MGRSSEEYNEHRSGERSCRQKPCKQSTCGESSRSARLCAGTPPKQPEANQNSRGPGREGWANDPAKICFPASKNTRARHAEESEPEANRDVQDAIPEVTPDGIKVHVHGTA